ncbi:MAG: hypothetical protein JO166_16325 [Deltaproteobacteria bacterium]|nr:hypothetical protein [Deltaproteobacteria bacterium]
MSDRFETDAMEDLFADQAEGAAEFDEGDEDAADELDAGEEDEFLSRVVSGVGQVLGADEFDEMEDLGEVDAGEELESVDSLDDAVADALEAEDTDEFFRRVARIARRVGRGVGRAARVIAPIASAIPLPHAQAIGRIAGIAGRLLADGADEFEAIDELVDLAEDEDTIDAAAPLIAGLTLRKVMPGVSRLPRPARRQLVRGVSQATRTLARRQGPQAARAVPRIVRSAQRAVRQRRIPARAIPRLVRRTAARVSRSPQAIRRLARPVSSLVGGRTMAGLSRGRMIGRPTLGWGQGGRARRYKFRGPVELTIRSL